jgi:hypothetical protein
VVGQCRGGGLLELRDQAGFIRRRDGAPPAGTRARHERAPRLSLRQITIDRAAMQAKLSGNRRDWRPSVDGGHDAVTQIEMIGTHAGLPPVTSITPSHSLRKDALKRPEDRDAYPDDSSPRSGHSHGNLSTQQ